MTWTVWDYVVVAFAVLQLAALLGLLVMVLRIVRGPVHNMAGRGGDLAARGRSVADAVQRAAKANAVHVKGIAADVKGIADSLRVPDRAASLPINYGALRRGITVLMTTRRGVQALKALQKRRTTAAASVPPGPAGGAKRRAAAQRASLAERLGLVPPAARYVTRFLPYARMLWEVRNQLRG